MKLLQTAYLALCLELPAKTPGLPVSHVDTGVQSDISHKPNTGLYQS